MNPLIPLNLPIPSNPHHPPFPTLEIPMPLQILIPLPRHPRRQPIFDVVRALDLATKVALHDRAEGGDGVDAHFGADEGEVAVAGRDV